jgi:SAM-dependent methyltransferase
MTPFRISMTAKIQELVHYGIKFPVVDIGGSNRHWLKEAFGIDNVRVWDIQPGNDRVFDLCKPDVKQPTFNTVISICVLEHVKNPFVAVNSLYDLLYPDGIIYITVPFIYPFHGAPNDYWRFTAEGLKELCKQFNILECGYFYKTDGVYLVGKK